MAEASALGLTMLQYCENSQIYRMGFVNNLQEDTKYLQKPYAFFRLHQYTGVDYLHLNDAKSNTTTGIFEDIFLQINGMQSWSDDVSFPVLKKETNLICIRLLHKRNKVGDSAFLVSGLKQKRINQLQIEGNVCISETKQKKCVKSENETIFSASRILTAKPEFSQNQK